MSDYTPYTPTTEEVLKASTGRTRPLFDAHFYRWLVAHEEQIRSTAFQEGYRTGCEEQKGKDSYDAYDKGYWDAVRGEQP